MTPACGQIADMEEMELTEKIKFLGDNELIKCMNKDEVLNEHKEFWTENGISAFKLRNEFTVLDAVYLGDYCIKITVELALNGNHWTDNKCGETDEQYEKNAGRKTK